MVCLRLEFLGPNVVLPESKNQVIQDPLSECTCSGQCRKVSSHHECPPDLLEEGIVKSQDRHRFRAEVNEIIRFSFDRPSSVLNYEPIAELFSNSSMPL